MSISLLGGIIALVLAIVVGILGRASTHTIMLCVAVAILAAIHVLGAGLIAR